eukprot:gene2856-1841_t
MITKLGGDFGALWCVRASSWVVGYWLVVFGMLNCAHFEVWVLLCSRVLWINKLGGDSGDFACGGATCRRAVGGVYLLVTGCVCIGGVWVCVFVNLVYVSGHFASDEICDVTNNSSCTVVILWTLVFLELDFVLFYCLRIGSIWYFCVRDVVLTVRCGVGNSVLVASAVNAYATCVGCMLRVYDFWFGRVRCGVLRGKDCCSCVHDAGVPSARFTPGGFVRRVLLLGSFDCVGNLMGEFVAWVAGEGPGYWALICVFYGLCWRFVVFEVCDVSSISCLALVCMYKLCGLLRYASRGFINYLRLLWGEGYYRRGEFCSSFTVLSFCVRVEAIALDFAWCLFEFGCPGGVLQVVEIDDCGGYVMVDCINYLFVQCGEFSAGVAMCSEYLIVVLCLLEDRGMFVRHRLWVTAGPDPMCVATCTYLLFWVPSVTARLLILRVMGLQHYVASVL